ncbi:MAG TPA: malto-oligosyltrehalose synthase, partial [Marmoricola sp.]|nr:malto-oligosyltrehalose synthase [Marmoricola sp.]
LGVDWVYLSPLLEAEPGSMHGYDVVRHDRVDASRGGAEGLAAVGAEARRLGMGVLVDIVPNHVGVATPVDNPWWWELLRDGRDAAHALAFDVDWAADDRVRIPVVGDDDLPSPDGAIHNLALREGELLYHDHRFPLAPGTWQEGDDANAVHDRQHYRLVSWRSADDQLNYRRFFAVNTLAAVRVEDRDVFEQSHVEIRRWIDEGLVDGLRVDHPDGLRHPKAYLDDLAELAGHRYVLVEKILEPGEQLSASWATAGTTGYDALAHLDRVLTDPAGEKPLTELAAALAESPVDWHAMVHGTKRAVADGILQSEVRRIARDAGLVRPDVHDALAELLACFPVYRSYLPEGRAHLDEAFERARSGRPDLAAVLDELAPLLHDPVHPAAWRFQQTSGMVMAKGVEDCAFYRFSRLTSLNEVGGDPSVFAATVEEFHHAMEQGQAHWPHAMTTLTTHDTKRSEDVRARIAVLAEVPARWAEVLDRLLAAAPLPDPGFGNLLWQAVVGAWPASRERLHAYAEKAMREAGDRTTWTAPDEAYEAAVHRAVDAAFDDEHVRTLVEELVDELTAPGWSNAISAKVVALTMPGVPDVYQGSELWEQSLVDPDNRRPVDFDHRARLLTSLPDGEPVPVSEVAKLQLTTIALRLRRARPELFTTYDALTATGPSAGHVLAFDRGGAITVATRLPVGLGARGGWDGTTLALPPGPWADAVTGRRFSGEAPLAHVLSEHPAAVLVKEES